MKKYLFNVTAACLLTSCIFASSASADTYIYDIYAEKHHEFAKQYPFHEGDDRKSFDEYPGISYISGIHTREDGIEYECPPFYQDSFFTKYDRFGTAATSVSLKINGEETDEKCAILDDRMLVPINAFALLGCDVDYNESSLVGTVSKDDTVLELLPCLIGMRKNQADGFYVPLEVCARLLDDILYVPVRAVADEFDFDVIWDNDTRSVNIINNK